MTYYLSLIPSSRAVGCGEPLNVLLLARSTGEDCEHEFRFWARGESDPSAGWRLVHSESKPLRADHNEHLYFQIPGAAFAGEEVTIAAGDTPPARDNKLCCLISVVRGENA